MAKNRREEKKRKIVSAKQRAAAGGNSFERPSLKLPAGCNVVTWNKEGVYRYDILPYELKKNHGNSFAKRFGLEAGDLYFERTYYTHRLPGEGNDSYACLKRNFNKPCPVCEEVARLAKEGASEDDYKPLRAKQRQLFNIIDKDDEEKGVQVFDSSTFGFGELLDTRVNAADDDDQFDTFADIETGKTLKITAKEQPGMKKFFKAVDIQFKDRKPYGDDILEKVFNLDDLVNELSYAELKKRFFAVPDDAGKTDPEDAADDGDDDTPPARGGKSPGKDGKAGASTAKPSSGRKPTSDDDDDDLKEQSADDDGEAEWMVDDQVEYTDPKTKKVKTGVIAELNDKNEIAGVEVEGMAKMQWVDYADLTLVEPEEEQEEEEEPEDEPPARTGKKPAGKTPAKTPSRRPEPTREDLDDDDDDLDSDIDDDDEPVDLDSDDDDEPRKKPAGKKPAGRR